LFTTPHFPPTVSAIICTRTESEVAEVFASFSLKFGCTNHLPFAVSAIICTRTESEVAEVFDSLSDIGGIEFYSFNTVGQLLRHMLLKGTLQDHTVLQDRLRRILGDLTFAEAYQRSGRILNVMVSAADTREPPRLLNYLTAPNVLIWSAVACSSAFPFLYVPQQLLARDSRGQVVPFIAQTAGEMQRRWRDGSLEEDLPMRGLSEMFNVNYFVVSQCNPYVLPLITLKRLVPRQVGSLVEGEFKHRWAAGRISCCVSACDYPPQCSYKSYKLRALPIAVGLYLCLQHLQTLPVNFCCPLHTSAAGASS
jgi:predicted acylesterase/phospholipase RssA